MRRLLLLSVLLLQASPVVAQSEIEAREAYVQCFVASGEKLLPHWCAKPDKLADFAHQSCFNEVIALNRVVGPKRADQVRASVFLDGKLAMLGRIQEYNAAGNCTR